MTHLPQQTSDDAATKGDIALLGPRFDRIDDQFNRIEDRFDRMDDRFDRIDDQFNRIEDRFNRMDDRMDKMQRNFLTVSFGTLSVMTAIFAFITRI